LATKETVVTDVDGKDKTVTTTEESTGTPPKPAPVTPDSVSAKPGQVEDVNKDGVVNQEDITLRDTEMEQLQKGLLANVNPTTGEPLSPEQIKRAQDRIAVLRKIKFAGE